MILRLEDLSFASHGKTVLDRLTVTIPDSSLTCLIGPNGAGKTTLLRILSGELHATSGKFLIGDTDASYLSQREIARQLAVIPQDVHPPPYLSVSELVGLGRFRPYGALWQRLSRRDLGVVESSLRRCQADSLKERPVEALSGGEQRRAWLAFGLAQEKRFLLLDETLDGLDVFAKRSFFELLKQATSEGTGIVLTTHDLDLVADYADKVIVLSSGKVIYDGPPDVDLERCLFNAGDSRQDAGRTIG